MFNYIDELKYVISGDDFVVNNHLTVYNPSIREIKMYGEDDYFHVLNLFVRKPYDVAVELFDKGVDYQSITDWDLFYETAPHIPIEYSCILFGKVNFEDFGQFINPENNMKYLVNKHDHEFVIDEAIYRQIVTYLRYVHFISEKVEYDAGNNMAKRFLIDRMRRKQKKIRKEFESGKRKRQSQIGNMIKYCVNNSNFKYNYSSVMDLKLCLLYESYYFITHSNERDNVLSGVYHGTIDTSKMKDKSILNIIPDLHK